MVLVTRPPARRRRSHRSWRSSRELNAAGLTSIRIPGGTAEQYRLLKQMRDAGALTVRVNFLFRLADAGSPERVREQVASWNAAPDEGDEWLRVGGMKLGVDGGFEGGLMREPYVEPWGVAPRSRPPDDARRRPRTAVRTLNALRVARRDARRRRCRDRSRC